jgi:hypothetical protein
MLKLYEDAVNRRAGMPKVVKKRPTAQAVQASAPSSARGQVKAPRTPFLG